jgi:hypothetical protein
MEKPKSEIGSAHELIDYMETIARASHIESGEMA